VTDPTTPARRSPLEHERDDMPIDLTPTIIRTLTLAEVWRLADDEIDAAYLRGLFIENVRAEKDAGNYVITIHWRPANAD